MFSNFLWKRIQEGKRNRWKIQLSLREGRHEGEGGGRQSEGGLTGLGH